MHVIACKDLVCMSVCVYTYTNKKRESTQLNSTQFFHEALRKIPESGEDEERRLQRVGAKINWE